MAAVVEKRTGAPAKTINGVTFHCYRIGVNRHQWRSEDGRIVAGRNYQRSTYHANLDGEPFYSRFRSLESAMGHAIKVMRHKESVA